MDKLVMARRAISIAILATVAFADGGVMLFRKQADPFVITAFGQPEPLRAGAMDLSVMVQKASDLTTVLDAKVNVRLKRSAGGSIVEVVAPATHAHATNKLLYAAHVTVPSAGEWQMSVEVNRANVTATASGGIQVLEAQEPAKTYWPYFAMVPVVVLLFVLNRWLKKKLVGRSRQARP